MDGFLAKVEMKIQAEKMAGYIKSGYGEEMFYNSDQKKNYFDNKEVPLPAISGEKVSKVLNMISPTIEEYIFPQEGRPLTLNKALDRLVSCLNIDGTVTSRKFLGIEENSQRKDSIMNKEKESKIF